MTCGYMRGSIRHHSSSRHSRENAITKATTKLERSAFDRSAVHDANVSLGIVGRMPLGNSCLVLLPSDICNRRGI